MDVILLISLIFVIYIYLIYPLVLWIISKFKLDSSDSKRGLRKENQRISIIIPTYNEELVIRSKLQSLVNEKFENACEIIVVDSGSDDNTCNIVREFEKCGVILIRQKKRLGKANAINLALSIAKGEIVAITDANSKFELEEIFKLAQNFNEDVGAVLPRLMPTQKVKLWHKLFLYVHHVIHIFESKCDSVFFVFGELFAFRKSLIDKIDENVASDDLEIAFIIRKKGFKIKYVPNVYVFEKTPETIRDDRIQRVRRAFGVLQVMKKNINMLLNPKFGLYGLVIFPTNFLRLTITPFLILLAITLCSVKILNLLFFLLSTCYGLLFVVSFSFAIILSKEFRQIISIFINFILTQFYIIFALIDLLRGKSYKIWKKIETTRNE